MVLSSGLLQPSVATATRQLLWMPLNVPQEAQIPPEMHPTHGQAFSVFSGSFPQAGIPGRTECFAPKEAEGFAFA